MQNTSAWFSRHFRIAKIQRADNDTNCKHE